MAQRLVYGPAEFAGYDGIVVDAVTAARWGAASRAKTWDEFSLAMHGMPWTQYATDEQIEEEGIGPYDAFSFEEWLADTWDAGPQEAAYDIAATRLTEIVAARRSEFGDVEMGGGSPAGHTTAITGPLDQLAALAMFVSDRDGFTLERDDDLVAEGLFRHLYG